MFKFLSRSKSEPQETRTIGDITVKATMESRGLLVRFANSECVLLPWDASLSELAVLISKKTVDRQMAMRDELDELFSET